MTREVLNNGMIRLHSDKGFKNTKTGLIHHDVICSEKNEKYFVEVE